MTETNMFMDDAPLRWTVARSAGLSVLMLLSFGGAYFVVAMMAVVELLRWRTKHLARGADSQ